MKRYAPPLVAEALGRCVYLDGAEIAHCSDPVAAELIAYGLTLAELDEEGRPRRRVVGKDVGGCPGCVDPACIRTHLCQRQEREREDDAR